MKRFISLAPYFFEESGHYHAYHSSLQEAMQSLGFTTETRIPHTCQVHPSKGNWVRHFYDSKKRIPLMFLRFFDYARIMFVLRKNGPNILLLESYAFLDLVALFWTVLCFSPRNTTIWQIFRDGLEWCRWKQKIHILFGRFLRWRLNGRYRALTDSSIVAGSLAKSLGSLHLLPIPHTAHSLTRLEHKDVLHLWLPGKARFDKGLQEIGQFCTSPDPSLAKIHLWIDPAPVLSGIQSNIQWHWQPPTLSRSQYLERLSSVHALLLPYDSRLYISRTSGPFVEAICAGVLVFTKEGNWLAHELAKHGLSECIVDWKNPLLPSLLLSIHQNEETKGKLTAMQQAYSTFHNLANFTETLRTLL